MKRTTALLIALIAAATAHHGGAAPYENVYTSGHADLGVAYEEEEGGMHFHYHFGSDAVINGSPLGGDGGEYDIGDATTYVAPDTKLFININPSVNNMLGLGASGGDLWYLPQTQNPALPFLGLATEDLDAGDWNGGITFTLNSVTGPGQFSLWSNGTFGEFNFEFSTQNPGGTVGGDNAVTLPIGTHSHYNWGFTAAGIYEVSITVSGNHKDFGLVSDTQTVTFGVETTPVPEPATYGAAVGLALLGFLIARRRKLAAA